MNLDIFGMMYWYVGIIFDYSGAGMIVGMMMGG